MAFQILLNIGLALIWMLLRTEYTVVEFMLGYIVGLLLLFVLRRFLHFDFYFRRVVAVFKLLVLFLYKLILSNIDMTKIVLSPNPDIQPGIIAVPTKLKTDWEVTLLANLISLTPGTLTMNFSEDGRTLFVHSIHVPDKEKAIAEIHDSFEKAIMEVTH
ncbi:Na+/H+ antiporter subunit E [Salipaludibacillus agaradhaerens]|jgi:multicomponent Na+:H+ antiporter subunit E|uniref:Na+/H+ antiporter subunit E n=1 Tax=Salipaludibacillus agaradhaerens TaxID=76935 RepID=A0A9Q4FYZ2_SALAG|nr:Na+/H+ antiporter subunit E [Salipaludibacillus agaradhaerens]UJW57412.1 Na+/H+ antiporter subunit E [Bacillus sp. A116_S68]MCR6096826.1 Na+/H+ antiporter subunit E [Salipaludibacillus agaradhaerens]MCR6106271.1 Na+/H+ antiporter subunit E [Salipaludibacillus agaradhaerens]MCR6113615.1 Na+/H+ antiporter subunit E [Salipaludibacillus agaradhaerens]MCR6118304.1 Na+/H+ antiporter subunit E [Salipaludibacillus agaradhaerens]